MILAWVFASFFVFGYCADDSENDAALRFYFRNFDEFKELPIDSAQDIFNTTWYDPIQDTVIFAHGFTGVPKGAAIKAVVTAYLEKGNNVALLNWEHLAAAVQPSLANSYVRWAAPNARKLGARFVSTLLNLEEAGLNLGTTHLVGHSLGAQLFGITGHNLMAKGIRIPWITGLDPASIGFENRPNNAKIHAGSAEFVDIIHSDPTKYGYKKSMGSVDFWPNFKNGAVLQPGCKAGTSPMFSPDDLCNHNRSWQYLVDSLKNNGTILGCYAKNYRTWKNLNKEERTNATLVLGSRPSNNVPLGDYFLTTKDSPPFGLGEEGL